MSSKDDDDGMDYLNKMRKKLASIQTVANDEEALQSVAINARERMNRIEELLAEPIHDAKPTTPPPGLTPQEEVEWWNKKIASLSGSVSADADSKCSPRRNENIGKAGPGYSVDKKSYK